MATRSTTQSLDKYYAQLRMRSERDDLVMFINACFAATNQNEYYANQLEQSISIGFLHQYVLANYRRVYARALAAGINHFNQSFIIANLLHAGAPANPDDRGEEGELIAQTMRSLPANRVYKLIRNLQSRRINNRRTRAVIKRYLDHRRDPSFDAVKYRTKFRSAAAHAHLPLDKEFHTFLFDLNATRSFSTPLFDSFQKARYSKSAIYDLPFTVAESLAQRHEIPRDQFLKKIEPKMTAAEKLRYQQVAGRTTGARIPFDLSRAPLTKLALYIASLSPEERDRRATELHGAMTKAAERAVAASRLSLGRVVAVLDRSRSSIGTRQKRNRPLGVALAMSYLLRAASSQYSAIWTPSLKESRHELSVDAAGQSDLAGPLIEALQQDADLVVIVSDGFENDPPDGAQQVVDIFQRRLRVDSCPEVVHLNPVFDADHYSPRRLGKSIATMGIRDAEDLATMLSFARFARGSASLAELEDYLAYRTRNWLGQNETP